MQHTQSGKSTRRLFLLAVLATATSLSACGQSPVELGTPADYTAPASAPASTGSTSMALNPTVQPEALQILAQHCESCHGTENMGGLNSITDPNHLLQLGLIVPGHPEASLLIQKVSQGLMPPTGPLSAVDVNTLTTWVRGTPVTTTSTSAGTGTMSADAGTTSTGTGTTSTGTGTMSADAGTMSAGTGTTSTGTGTTSNGGTGSLAQQVMAVLATNCESCHGASGSGGLSNITNLSSLVQGGWVTAGNPAGSPLYVQISQGTMPPGGGLAQADVQLVASWINAGAPAN